VQSRIGSVFIHLFNLRESLVAKGSILGGKYFERKGPKKYYSKAQLVVGMYELQATRLTEDDSDDNVRDIVLKTQRPMAVIECVCRSGKDLTEQPCKHSDIRETCILFEDIANFAISFETCRIVTKDEMLQILDRAEEADFVLQPENNQNPNFICCSCGCCCNVLTSVKKFPKPADFYHSNYNSAVTSEKCEACLTCVDICPMEAISADEGSATVDMDRCIGCGVCVSKCPANAIELKEKGSKYIPPKDSDALQMSFCRISCGRIRWVAVVSA
jgi:Pyruvate/2-oxoacid:ferredoxin oxidoreductase delta subunit